MILATSEMDSLDACHLSEPKMSQNLDNIISLRQFGFTHLSYSELSGLVGYIIIVRHFGVAV